MDAPRTRILSGFPYPIAYPYSLIFDEAKPPSHSRWALCFTVYQLLRVVCLALVGQYLREPINESARDDIAALNRAIAAIRSVSWTREWATPRIVVGPAAKGAMAARVCAMSEMSVIVPMVDRGLAPTGFWSMDPTGDNPLTNSTSGFFHCPSNHLAKVDLDPSHGPGDLDADAQERLVGERPEPDSSLDLGVVDPSFAVIASDRVPEGRTGARRSEEADWFAGCGRVDFLVVAGGPVASAAEKLDHQVRAEEASRRDPPIVERVEECPKAGLGQLDDFGRGRGRSRPLAFGWHVGSPPWATGVRAGGRRSPRPGVSVDQNAMGSRGASLYTAGRGASGSRPAASYRRRCRSGTQASCP